jgi:hypothetical protein
MSKERNAILERSRALQLEVAKINSEIDWLVDSSGQGGGLVDTLYSARESAQAERKELCELLEAMDDATDWDSMAEDYMDAVYYAEGAGL